MNKVVVREMAPAILLCLTAVGSAALWNRVSNGRDRIESSRAETDNRCDRYTSPHPGLCYATGLDDNFDWKWLRRAIAAANRPTVTCPSGPEWKPRGNSCWDGHNLWTPNKPRVITVYYVKDPPKH